MADCGMKTDPMVVVRHNLHAIAHTFLEGIIEGSEDVVRDEAQNAMRAVDALYVLGERLCVGPVDGDPA